MLPAKLVKWESDLSAYVAKTERDVRQRIAQMDGGGVGAAPGGGTGLHHAHTTTQAHQAQHHPLQSKANQLQQHYESTWAIAEKNQGEQQLAAVVQGAGKLAGKPCAGAASQRLANNTDHLGTVTSQLQPSTALDDSGGGGGKLAGHEAGKRIGMGRQSSAALVQEDGQASPDMRQGATVVEALAHWFNENQSAAFPEFVTGLLGSAMAEELPSSSFGVNPRHWVLPNLNRNRPRLDIDEVSGVVQTVDGGGGGTKGGNAAVQVEEGVYGAAAVTSARSTSTGVGEGGGAGDVVGDVVGGGREEEVGFGSGAPHSKRRRSSVQVNAIAISGIRNGGGGAGTIELKRELAYIRERMWTRFSYVVDESLGMFETSNGGCLLWCDLLTEGLPKIPPLSIHIPDGYPNGPTEHTAPRLGLALAPE